MWKIWVGVLGLLLLFFGMAGHVCANTIVEEDTQREIRRDQKKAAKRHVKRSRKPRAQEIAFPDPTRRGQITTRGKKPPPTTLQDSEKQLK